MKGIEPEQKKTWKKDKLPMKSGFYASFLFFSCFLGVLGISTMKISEEEVRHVATLSKLAFSDEETTEFATTLTKIVEMVELLNEVDTTGVAITTTMADRRTVLRPDVAEEGTDRDQLFKNVPEAKDYYIKVPAILDDGGDA